MELFLIAFGVMALAACGMALGALAGRRPWRSGCGEAACELSTPWLARLASGREAS